MCGGGAVVCVDGVGVILCGGGQLCVLEGVCGQ